ncbi:MAG: hypothetical protein ACRDTD_28785 [Pseudonocardiaceae bacterium]
MTSNKQQWDADDVTAILINPVYAISIDPGLLGEHPPLVSEDQWIAANRRLLDEMGADRYLRQLLDVLKGNHPKQP